MIKLARNAIIVFPMDFCALSISTYIVANITLFAAVLCLVFFSNAIISRLFYSSVFLFYRYALLSFVVQYLFCWFFFIVYLGLSRVFVKTWLTEITSVAVNVLSSKFFHFFFLVQQIISSDHLVLAYNSIYAIDVLCFFVLFYRLK